MKRVLISPADNHRLCDIVDPGQEFAVASPLMWVDAPDDVSPSTHVFSNGAVVTKPPKPFNEAKADKLKELERARNRAIDTLPPVRVAGKDYPANTEYREVITGIARRKAAWRGRPARLRGQDGTEVVLTDALIDQIDDAITVAVQAQWDRYWQRVDAVQAATTVEQVNAVEW